MSCARPSYAASSSQCTNLIVAKDTRTDEEPNPLRTLQRKHSPSARNHIKDKLRVLPVLELTLAHIEGCIAESSEKHIAVANKKFSSRVTHGGAAVAASA
jgi:hypothetical protein